LLHSIPYLRTVSFFTLPSIPYNTFSNRQFIIIKLDYEYKNSKTNSHMENKSPPNFQSSMENQMPAFFDS
jgi:hypothetical protein